MNDLEREKTQGFGYGYLLGALPRRLAVGRRYQTPGFGLAAQLFASLCRVIIRKLGPEEGEALIREAVQAFGRERGRRIAERVRGLGKPLSFKNWLTYGDISGVNFSARPEIHNHDLVAQVRACSFLDAAREWGMEEFAGLYCKYADHAILEGYNPDVKLELETRHETGRDHCLFRYIMKEENKQGSPPGE